MKRLFRSVVLACAIIMVAGPAFAQSPAAAVSGTVYDEQHAVLPGAAITLKNLDTGQVQETISGQTGSFRLIGLAPGHYEASVALSGFATAVRLIDLTVT